MGTSDDETITLYRPVGPKELALIEQSQFRAFPPRLPEQPIFYPVLTEEYAVKIARDWNVPASGAGFVTRFRVRRSYISRYQPQDAGGRDLREYWIPAEELDQFNDNIVGEIEVIREFGRGTDSLSSIELNAIKLRYLSATEGPWKSYVEGREEMSGESFIQTGRDDIYLTGATTADQDFIAHARQDVPRLVQEIERLLIEVARLEQK